MGDPSNLSEDTFLEQIAAATKRGESYRADGVRNALLFRRAQQLLERQGWQLRPFGKDEGKQKYRRALNEVVDVMVAHSGKRGYDDVCVAALILEALANLEDHLARPSHEEEFSEAIARVGSAYRALGDITRFSQQYMEGEIEGTVRRWRNADAARERMKDINDARGREGDWHEQIFVLVAREQYLDHVQGHKRGDVAIYDAAAVRLEAIEPSDEYKNADAIRKSLSRKPQTFGEIKIAVFDILNATPEISDSDLIAQALHTVSGHTTVS